MVGGCDIAGGRCVACEWLVGWMVVGGFGLWWVGIGVTEGVVFGGDVGCCLVVFGWCW